MLNTVKSKAISTKQFVYKHRVALTVTATSAFWIAVMAKSAEQHNEFLKEKGLFDEFYAVGNTEEDAVPSV